MTKIIISKKPNGEYTGFSCSGHAGFQPKGKDIVCAALSLLTINTINSLEKLTAEIIEVEEDERSASISCRFTGPMTDGGRLLMESYELGCREVSGNYGTRYVNLEIKEV